MTATRQENLHAGALHLFIIDNWALQPLRVALSTATLTSSVFAVTRLLFALFMTINFTRTLLLISGAVGFFVFSEVPTLNSILEAGIIVLAIMLLSIYLKNRCKETR